MPYDDPDVDDPSMLVGVELPARIEQLREMAWQFADELARSGRSEDEVVALFAEPFYGGAHLAYRALGHEEIQEIARESVHVWGRFRINLVDAAEVDEEGRRYLPMIRQ